MIYVSQGLLQVALPEVQGFRISPKRMTAEKTAVAGNTIRQYSILHESSATANYSGVIDSALASVLDAMHAGASNVVTLTWRNVSYVASMTYDGEPAKAGQHSVSITFAITRRVQ